MFLLNLIELFSDESKKTANGLNTGQPILQTWHLQEQILSHT